MTSHEVLRPGSEATSIEALAQALQAAGIDLDTWGRGEAKTLAHLHQEILDGESTLKAVENGVERRLGVAQVDVLHVDQAGNAYILMEDRQEFRDGRIRRRQLGTSLGEKLKVGEDPEAAARRALQEEIGITEVETFYSLGYQESVRKSESYPDLDSIYCAHIYVAVIGSDNFHPEGYVEEQPDKISFYIWSPISSKPTQK